jgi:HD-GYP domain-containing protein (c-di-GMP phosphodiesterase class II)
MAKKQVPISSVKVGMYLCGIDRSWLDTPFLRHRFLIRSTADLTKLQHCGIQAITIDTERGLDDTSNTETEHQEKTPATPPPKATRVTNQTSIPPEVERLQHLPQEIQGKSLGGELTSIQHTRHFMLEDVKDILETLAKTGGIAIEQVNGVTQSIMEDTLDHEEAYIALICTRAFSPAMYDHALAVSTLSVLLGRAVGLEESICQDLAIAGLLHDAGLAKIPQTLHRPLNELSDSELKVYQSHPQRGLNLLMQQSALSERVQTWIREHHVALDGSGYPTDIDPATIQPASRILRLVDEYDELLGGHQSGKPQTVRGALQNVYQQGKKGVLDADLVGKFINLIGIYPTYSLVELSTGERGIVTANSKENLLHPTILLIQDAAHQPLTDPIPFNFSVLGTEIPGPEIVKILSPEDAGIQLDTALEDWVTL